MDYGPDAVAACLSINLVYIQYVYNCRAAEEYYYQALAIYEANPDVSPAQVLKVKCPSSVRTHFLRDLRMFNSCALMKVYLLICACDYCASSSYQSREQCFQLPNTHVLCTLCRLLKLWLVSWRS